LNGETKVSGDHAKVAVDERIVHATPFAGGVSIANEGVPTQVANPSRASWRTFIQSTISFLILLNVALPILYNYLEANVEDATLVLGPVYPVVRAVANFLVILFGLVAKLIALLMANPTVNAWITEHLSWLAPIPQKDAPALR
jgi:hypothetical protein